MFDERVCCVLCFYVCYLLEESDNRIAGHSIFRGSRKRNNFTELIYFYVLICFHTKLRFSKLVRTSFIYDYLIIFYDLYFVISYTVLRPLDASPSQGYTTTNVLENPG